MYISLTGNPDNKDVYIKRSYRKSNGKTATQIHRKLGKMNELLEQFSGDYDAMMAWARSEAEKTLWNTTPKQAVLQFLYQEALIFPK